MKKYMTLREYLFKKDMSLKEFGELIGISRQYVSMIVRGHRKPSKSLAKVIEIQTLEKVSAAELRGINIRD